MQPRQIIVVLVTLILILGAALFVVTVGGDDDEPDETAATSSTTSSTTSTTTTTTTTIAAVTTTIPTECAAEDDETAEADDTAESTTTTVDPNADPEDADADADEEAPTTSLSPQLGPNDSVSTVGFGEVDFGMTVFQAEQAAGTTMLPCSPVSECYRVIPEVAPAGISFLVTAGTIERIDIVSGAVTTRSGIGIGTEQDRIVELFGDQIETQVNDDSSVDLIFVPQDEGDAQFRVIFTVRDGVVDSFRSGRVPQVTDIDPCADDA